MKFLKGRHAKILTLLLLVQGTLFYAVAFRAELTPPIAPLSLFPFDIHGWHCIQEIPLEPEIQDLLKADDTLNRIYSNTDRTKTVSLFIGYFKTQRYGQAPHSPKNCLPGSGWEPVETGKISIPVPDWKGPIVANKYVVAHGDERDVVLYWYQSHNRVIANEYTARFYLVLDAIRYRRSDTAIVRVIVPEQNRQTDRATSLGIQFIQDFFPEIVRRLPL
jgi:EpsI family protein